MQSCNTKVYDTFTLQPYIYPNQERSAIYQCDNNSFSLGASVKGGVGPFTYQIIGSSPETPSINAVQYNNPVFTINNGTTYSLIRLRTIDACGNATLNDVSVLPIQNIVIRATSTCMYNNVVLSVDSIPNASYHWYKRHSATDSTLVGDSLRYDIPFLVPEQTGTYICKVTVNNECITRLSYFDLTGNCDHQFLPITVTLKGESKGGNNYLSWQTKAEEEVLSYSIERKGANEKEYKPLGKVTPTTRLKNKVYNFIDKNTIAGVATYRIKITGAGKSYAYSNSVNLKAASFIATIFPNPVKDYLSITLAGKGACNYTLELSTMTGQVVYKKELKRIVNSTFRYSRETALEQGMYLLKVTNTTTGASEVFKLLFE
jgi:hypothetical protein